MTERLTKARLRPYGRPLSKGWAYDLWATSNLFKAGHCIRLEISSSNFPRFDRNPNTGRTLAAETELLPAVQTVSHDGTYPSHVTLPMIPLA